METPQNTPMRLTHRGWLALVVLPLYIMGFGLLLHAAFTPDLLTVNGASLVGFGMALSGIVVHMKHL